jgi:uncharacterized membrane protein
MELLSSDESAIEVSTWRQDRATLESDLSGHSPAVMRVKKGQKRRLGWETTGWWEEGIATNF